MELSKRLPFPVGILYGVLVGAFIGAVASVLLANVRNRKTDGEIEGKSPGVGDFVRVVVAAGALIRIANEFLAPKDEKA